MKLSILICSIRGRERALKRLLDILLVGKWEHEMDYNMTRKIDRYFTGEAEIIVFSDNKQISIGRKRNELTRRAIGDWISFIDDDDIVESDYAQQILSKTSTNPDCIVFDAFRFDNGRKDRLVKYGIEYKSDYNTPECYFRIPNHLMAFKREIALHVPYPNVSFGEDSDFAKKVLPFIRTQERIDKVLYHYLFTNQSTSTKTIRR
jgi:hypothetical protein